MRKHKQNNSISFKVTSNNTWYVVIEIKKIFVSLSITRHCYTGLNNPTPTAILFCF